MAGWARAARGDPSGLVQLRAGIDACARMGARSTRPFNLAPLAEALVRTGGLDEGRRVLASALWIARTSGELWRQSALNRLSADLCVLAGHPEAARRALRRARVLAGAQGRALFAERAAARSVRLRGAKQSGS